MAKDHVHLASSVYHDAPTPLSPTSHANASQGKKKKHKKVKPRNGAGVKNEFDDLPHLEPVTPTEQTHQRSTTRTGLSPELESVHLSATESLSATAAATARLNATVAAQAELLATATDLYSKMDIDPGLSVTNENEYLGALPANIRNFVQNAWASIAGIGSDENKQETMYEIAQQIMQPGVGLKTSPGRGTSHQGAPSLSYPLPFDFSAFDQAVEQATRAGGFGGVLPAPGQPPRGPLPPTNVVLMNEFGEAQHGDVPEDYYSEDEVDEDVDDVDVDHMRDELHEAGARMRLSYDDGLFGAPGTITRLDGTMHVVGKRKNKKKKKKGRVEGQNSSLPPPSSGLVAVPRPDPDLGTVTTRPAGRGAGGGESVTLAVTQPHSNSNPMPAARTQVSNPPPSSRAAGKQPMSYTPAPATTPAAPPANAAPPRSARAASKAPLPANSYPHNHPHHHPSPPSSNASVPQKHRPPGAAAQPQAPPKSNKIWSTNSSEERERIKEFWLGLGEEDRRALVKVEKEAVLRKMKEQQKHSCSCAVCGRKRNAIEEELEVLYDAYYEELEQYANYQQQYASSGGTLPPPPGPGPFPGSVELDKNGAVVGHGQTGKPHAAHVPRGKPNALTTNGRGKKVTESEFDEDDPDNDEYEEEEYDDEEEDEDEDDVDDLEGEDDVDARPRGPRRGVPPARRQPPATNGTKANGRDDLFNFGNSLTVTGPGNILTVADDLLKNDGQKFLEMMEQLAERRMQREEEAAGDVEDDSEEEDEEDDGDEDDEDEDEDEEDDEDDEEEVMTEEQKMEEGKKMFSIFAARMFEQRVLQAYREKVAQERQLQLLRELEDEDKLSKEREAKKQKENQKKKDKKKQQKQAKEEEKAAKAAEKAAEEAAQREKQRRIEEEQRKKREEERLKREAAKKAQEEERLRKEEERRKRLAEEKEREAERERKRKEKEEKLKAERKDREEKERKAREEREAKLAAERAAEKAKKEQQEKEEREKRLAKEREEKAEREAKERLALQHQQQRAAAPKPRSPTSPRNNAVASGSTQRQQSLPVPPKKILNKPPPVAPVAQLPRQQPPRPIVISSQPSTPLSPASQPITQNLPQPHISPVTYSPGGPIPPPAMSPRTPFPPPGPFGGYPPPPMQQMPPGSLAPSALPRAFGGPLYEPGFGRGMVTAAPIGPPPKAGLPNPLVSPISASMPPGPSVINRRLSTAADPGPITRPIAPIARPSGEPSGSGSGSGTGSPTRRSPSPKGVLGSAALKADDDEVVPTPNRRVAPGPVGQGWQSPRSSTIISAPWGSPGPTAPNFTTTPRPLSATNLWGNATNPDWISHQHPSSNFFGGQFANHAPSPPPHSGN